jgi:hypothetical protein
MESNKNLTQDKTTGGQSKSTTTGGTANTTTGQTPGTPGGSTIGGHSVGGSSTGGSTIGGGTGGSSIGGQSHNTTASAPQRAREEGSGGQSGTQEILGQTREAVTNAYEKTSEVLSTSYDQAMSYGRENPGKLTLIAFGAGIGIGLLLASGMGGRSRTERIAEPIVGALSQIALEIFR